MSNEAIELAKEGIEIHSQRDPEYIVCAEVLRLHEVEKNQQWLTKKFELEMQRLHEVNEALFEALQTILENDGGEGSKCYHAIRLYNARESGKVALAKSTGEFESPSEKPLANEVENSGSSMDSADSAETFDKREWVWLTDDDRIEIAESMDGGIKGFLMGWGWLNYAKALEAKCMEKNI